jgi:hypothetical protein
MRERDMRLRVERFIQTRLRSMLMPATLGLGMALGGCNSDGLNADDGGDPTANQDAAGNTDTYVAPQSDAEDKKDTGMVTKYMAPVYSAMVPDAGPELPIGAPDYMAPIVKHDAGIPVRYMAQMPPDADPGTAVAMYIAQIPKA